MKKRHIYVLLVCFCLCLSAFVGYKYVVYKYGVEDGLEYDEKEKRYEMPGLRFIREPYTSLTETNTDSILSESRIDHNLSKYDTLLKIGLNEVNDKNSFVVPGMVATKTLTNNVTGNSSMCTSMTPQGICVTDHYIFISAYCHTHTHNSVLYMLDMKTHAFIKEIVLPGRPHAGNIAYDPVHNNIWIACVGKSFLTNTSTAYLNCISLDKIEEYDFNESKEPIPYDQKYQIDGFKNASFITYYKQNIFVGNYYEDEWKDSYIVRFPITEDGGLETKSVSSLFGDKELAVGKEKAIIGKYCQGVCFDKGYLMIMQSSGRMKSKLNVYVGSEYQEDVEEMIELENKHREFENHANICETYPIMMEEKEEQVNQYVEQIDEIEKELVTLDEEIEKYLEQKQEGEEYEALLNKQEELNSKKEEIQIQKDELETEIQSLQETLDEELKVEIDFDLEEYNEKCNREIIYSLEDDLASATYELPARLEQAMISPLDEYRLYLLFESGAQAYRNQLGVDVVDRVLIIQ